MLLKNFSEVLAGVLAATVAMEDQPGVLARLALEPSHAQGIDGDVARHVLTQAPAHHLAAEQLDHHGQIAKYAFTGPMLHWSIG